MKNENKFYKTLENIFVGNKIEGQGGFVNLLKIKEKYYSKVINIFKKEVNEDKNISDNFKEEFYNKLYTFFEKYFNECGSVYFVKTSNWQKVYEKIYTSDDDVILFWKTNMLYYVKSDILFSNMIINITEDNKEYKFYFNIDETIQKQNNTKQKLIYEFNKKNKNEINITVINSTKNKKTDITNISNKCNISETSIEKAINNFEKQNKVDYFINRNAQEFLLEQLDLFLHQILIEDKNKFEQNRLNQLKSLKKYATKLINFISQFEDELVKVWNKPKFVLNSNYVITCNKLSKKILEKIIKNKNYKEQIKEWKKLGILDKTATIDDLVNSTLPIDTKYFKDIEIEILSEFNDIDNELDGRLIQSENYQALLTLQNKYKNKIDCIYIDPPFNTGEDFLYLDNYQDSTWLSIMKDRMDLANKLISDNGCFWLHLDNNANVYGKYLLNNNYNDITEIIFDTNATKDEEADVFGYKSFGDNFQLKHQTIYYCRKNDYIFNKLWKPNRNTTKLNIGWLDLLAKPKVEKPKKIADFTFGIEKWDNNELKFNEIDLQEESIYPVGDIWNDIFSFTQSEMRVSESFSFTSSQKPENLMRRIIQSSTNHKNYVMDFFSGSGTTISTAHKLNRKWIGIEMGEHFNEFYFDGDKEKIGILGRMKYVLNGDQKITKLERRPHLSKDINWQGGGFFKYYKLEQYEDTLSKAKYNSEQEQISFFDNKSVFEQYIFFSDNKLVDFIKEKNKELSVDFDKLYKNIDIPETISNLLGMPIKRINKNSVVLNDNGKDKEISFDINNMTEDEKNNFLHLIMPLLWWGK